MMAKYEDWDKATKPTPGDVVRLKAGGMLMTVESGTEGEAKCVWFNEDKELQRGVFRAAALQRKK